MDKPSILVSGAAGIVGYGILLSLRQLKDQYRLIGSTIYDFSAADLYSDIVLKALPTDHPNYLEWLCDSINKHQVAMVIPGIECDMLKWNKHSREILSAGALPLLNNKTLIELCNDKWEFYKALMLSHSRYAISTRIEASFSEYPLPFILKPRRGYGSKGIIKVTTKGEFEKNKERIGQELIQQPLVGTDDEEYTVSAFFDNESLLIDLLPLKRKLSAAGYTQEAEFTEFDFTEVIKELAFTFKPTGPTNFQFRKEKDEMKLLEINPRISSATSIRTALGYNESKMSIDYFLNNTFPTRLDRSMIRGAHVIRYIEDHIFL